MASRFDVSDVEETKVAKEIEGKSLYSSPFPSYQVRTIYIIFCLGDEDISLQVPKIVIEGESKEEEANKELNDFTLTSEGNLALYEVGPGNKWHLLFIINSVLMRGYHLPKGRV